MCLPGLVKPVIRECSVNLSRRDDRLAMQLANMQPSKILLRRKSTVVHSVSQKPVISAIRRHSTEVNPMTAAKKSRVEKKVSFAERGTKKCMKLIALSGF